MEGYYESQEGKLSKILILGATGYLGKFMVKASVSMGHPTFAYVRPLLTAPKLDFFHSMGVTLFQGQLGQRNKLVSVLRQVDVVISTLAVPQYLEQLKIIEAMKEAGNIKRFVPSDFGNEADRVSGLPPFQAILDNKKKIRRATEEAGIPYTYVSANSLGAYFVDYLLHPHQAPPSDEVVIYGSGEAKAVLNYEEDVAAYTVMAATDPRASNRLIIVRPPANIASQLDLVSSWEKKTGRTLKRKHVAEQDVIELSQSLPFPDNVPLAILHNIFIKGDQMSFELTEHDLEASAFYPHHKYTSVDQILDSCLLNPANPKLATFS